MLDVNADGSSFLRAPVLLLSVAWPCVARSKAQTQSFDRVFRSPTGNSCNGNGVASINPRHNFWTNYRRGWVVRGGVGFTVP